MKKLLLVGISVAIFSQTQFVRAAAFTTGDIVIMRFGDGSAALSSAATAAFLDEYSPLGVLVQSIALPTSTSGSQRRLTVAGNATSEGFMRLSADGTALVMPGYDAALGTATVANTAPGTVNRVIGVVGPGGVVDTTTALSTGVGASGNLRSVTSDNGGRFWTGTSAAGVGFVSSIGASSATQLATAPSNARVVGIYGGQLYTGSGSSPFVGISSVGSGLPTASGQTATLAIPDGGASPSPYGFVLADLNPLVAGLDTAWVADDRTIVNGGGIQKYLFDGTSWTLSYTLGTGVGSTVGARGLTVDLSGTSPVIFATTTESSANRLISIVDTGSGSTATVLATAAANEAFRGLDFAPQTIPEPTTLSLFGGFGLLYLFLRRRK